MLYENRMKAAMARNMKGAKKTRITGEDKLEDANMAGKAEHS